MNFGHLGKAGHVGLQATEPDQAGIRGAGAGAPGPALLGGAAADQERARRGGPGAGHLHAGLPLLRQVRARHQHQGLALQDPHQHLHQPLPPQGEGAQRGGGRRARGGARALRQPRRHRLRGQPRAVLLRPAAVGRRAARHRRAAHRLPAGGDPRGPPGVLLQGDRRDPRVPGGHGDEPAVPRAQAAAEDPARITRQGQGVLRSCTKSPSAPEPGRVPAKEEDRVERVDGPQGRLSPRAAWHLRARRPLMTCQELDRCSTPTSTASSSPRNAMDVEHHLKTCAALPAPGGRRSRRFSRRSGAPRRHAVQPSRARAPSLRAGIELGLAARAAPRPRAAPVAARRAPPRWWW